MQTLPKIALPLAGIDRRDAAISLGDKPDPAGGDRFDSIYAEEGNAEIDGRHGGTDIDMQEATDSDATVLDGKDPVHEQEVRPGPVAGRDSGPGAGGWVSEAAGSRALGDSEPASLEARRRAGDANTGAPGQVVGGEASGNQTSSTDQAERRGGSDELAVLPQVTGTLGTRENSLDRMQTQASAPATPIGTTFVSGMEPPNSAPVGAYTRASLLTPGQPEIAGVQKAVLQGGNVSGVQVAGVGEGIPEIPQLPALKSPGADSGNSIGPRTVEMAGTPLNGGVLENRMATSVPAQDYENSYSGTGGTEQDFRPIAGSPTIASSSKAIPWQVSFAPVGPQEPGGSLSAAKGQDSFSFALEQPATVPLGGPGLKLDSRESQIFGAFTTPPQTPVFVSGPVANDTGLVESLTLVSETAAQPVSNAFAVSSDVGTTARSAPQITPNSTIALRQVTDAMVAANDQNIELTLDPPELGRVRMSMSEQNGSLTVVIESDQTSTQNLIRKNQDLLRQDLLALGYSGISFEFDQGGQDNGKHDSRDLNALNQESAAEADDRNALQSRQILVASGVDIRV